MHETSRFEKVNHYARYEHKNNSGTPLPTAGFRAGKKIKNKFATSKTRVEQDPTITESSALGESRLLLTTDHNS